MVIIQVVLSLVGSVDQHVAISTIIGAEVGGKQTANSGNPCILYGELINNFEPGNKG